MFNACLQESLASVKAGEAGCGVEQLAGYVAMLGDAKLRDTLLLLLDA